MARGGFNCGCLSLSLYRNCCIFNQLSFEATLHRIVITFVLKVFNTVEPRLSELRLTETRVNRNAFFFVREMILSKLNC